MTVERCNCDMGWSDRDEDYVRVPSGNCPVHGAG